MLSRCVPKKIKSLPHTESKAILLFFCLLVNICSEINAVDLVRLHDPLRAEMAPFTGDYYQFLETDVMTGKCAKMCRAALK